MSNMSYCRFINTRTDLNDCLDLLRHDERMELYSLPRGERYVLCGSFSGRFFFTSVE